MGYIITNKSTGEGLKGILGRNWRLPVWADKSKAYQFTALDKAKKFAKSLGADLDKIKIEKQ